MSIQCDRCFITLTNWDYRYKGLHYCRTCYNSLFTIRTCSVCNNKKMIFAKLKIPVCKICQVKDAPCIRCGKKDYSFGKITKDGSVCLSCSTYFREYKECTKCHIKSYTIYNRTIKDGESKLLCGNCYNKTLPTCIKCHKQRKAYTYNNSNQPICKVCVEKGNKICKTCGVSFPAGMGNICRSCNYKTSLEKRAMFGSKSLSHYNSQLFYQFAYWLGDRRGFLFASTSIKKYYILFLDIDKYAQTLNRYPTYLEIISKFTSKKLNKYSLVVSFLNELRIIKINPDIKEEYSNRGKIDKYLHTFPNKSQRHKIILAYYEMLHHKYTMKKTTIRSIRLALTPAVKFLEYSTFTSSQKISNEVLQSYLWIYSGQKSAITGFISFLNKTYNLLLIMPKEKAVLKKPTKSHAQLKQQYINALRNQENTLSYKQSVLTLSIEYLHKVAIPNDIILPFTDIKKKKNGDCYIRLVGQEFYLPIEIYTIIHSK